MKKAGPEEEIEALRAAYAKDLPLKTGELQRELEQAVRQLGAGKTPGWKEVEYFAHKLCGSSGTYGFLHLSALCGHLEDLVTDGSLEALAAAKPALAAELLAAWLAVFSVQARLAHERKPPAGTPNELLAPLKQHLAALASGKAA